jgi:DNA polymerase
MAEGFTSEGDHADLRRELCNYLRILESSGVTEIALADGRPSCGADGADGGGGSDAADGTNGVDGADRLGQAKVSWMSDGAGAMSGADAVEALRQAAEACRACFLHRGRTKVVFGEGNPAGRLMFIGEGPGADEDREGRPFVGRAGALLTRIIEAMGLVREEVYIANVVKCRPPGNRTPEPDEIASCLPYLEKQIDLVRPEAICTLGNVATHAVTGERRPISEMRWNAYDYRGIRVFPTFHPAACLRNPDCKKLVWEDVKKIMRMFNLPIRGVKNGPGANRD